MNTPTIDPLRRAAELATGTRSSRDGDDATSDTPTDADALEHRLKRDAFDSIGRIKPAVVAGVDFDAEVLDGDFFARQPPPLQGIAIARSEGMLAFYNRVGWRRAFLDEPLAPHVPEDGLAPLAERYHARTLHDLAYVHPKHFEKMLGKAGAASLWERLGRFGRAGDDAATGTPEA